jgi:alditol oxidase
MPVTNWAGNVTFTASSLSRPGSVAELQRLVAGSERVRVLGSGHSFNRIADTAGTLVSLGDLPGGVDVDTAAGTARVAAGVRFGELYRALDRAGLALPNTGSLPHISVAGAASTGTHGSGDRNRNLAAGISAIDLVTTTGELVTLDRSSPDFPGSVLALGALGVMTAVTVDAVPAYEVRQDVYLDLPLEVLTARFDEIFAAAYSVSVFLDWRRPVANQVWLKQRLGDPLVTDSSWYDARRADTPVHPVDGMPPEHATEQLGVPGPWYERMPHFRLDFTPSSGDELQSEFLVPRDRAVEALRALDVVSSEVASVLQIAELRTVAADELWLSPAYRTDLAGFHFTWVPDFATVQPVLTAVEQALAPYEARPHWGKLFGHVPAEHFPRLPDFLALRDRLDPDRTFSNDLLDTWLGR